MLTNRLVEPPIVGGAANTFCHSERVEGSVGEIDTTTDAFHTLVLDGSLHSLAAIADGDGFRRQAFTTTSSPPNSNPSNILT